MPSADHTPSRLESAVTVASIVALALGLLALTASLVVGMTDRFAVAEGLWPVVYGIAFFGLPIGFVLLVLAILLAQRRRRAALREAGAAGA